MSTRLDEDMYLALQNPITEDTVYSTTYLTTVESLIKIKRFNSLAKLPSRSHPNDAGADLFSVVNAGIAPNTRISIQTGIAIENHDPDTYFRIAPRSGLANKHGIDVLAGVVDCGYTGEIVVILLNTSSEYVTIRVGDKIAQLIHERIYRPAFEWTNDLSVSDRGNNGFGSTDQI